MAYFEGVLGVLLTGVEDAQYVNGAVQCSAVQRCDMRFAAKETVKVWNEASKKPDSEPAKISSDEFEGTQKCNVETPESGPSSYSRGPRM